jgi:hypothetical protein
MRMWLSALILVAATLATTGCGGSKNESTATSSTAVSSIATTSVTNASSPTGSTGNGSGKPLSASQLVVKADAICAQLNIELNKDRVRTEQDIVRVVPHRVTIEQAALAELSKLRPPISLARDYQQMLATRRTLIEDTSRLGSDAAAKDSQAVQVAFSSGTALIRQMAVTARRDGFKYCGQLG